MVLLTITTNQLQALEDRDLLRLGINSITTSPDDPPIDPASAKLGDPISHGQIIDLWKALTAAGQTKYTLEKLLQGSTVYIPPPPPKPEKSDEYKALMARLRRDEEAAAYTRMLNPPAPRETFSQAFPSASQIHRPANTADADDEEVTYDDVHRQLMLILNFAVSILGVAATLWILGRWWSTPARLLLTMAGSAVVGVAEVGLYQGYLWHLEEAKKKDKKFREGFREVKSVVKTWVVGAGEGEEEEQEAESAPVAVGATATERKPQAVRRKTRRA